jgi:plasmid stabilization system protein ParE
MKIKWSQKAYRNLEKILSHTEENFSKEKAISVYNEILNSAEKLTLFPQMGKPFGPEQTLRFFEVDKNVILYEIILEKEPLIYIATLIQRKTKDSK